MTTQQSSLAAPPPVTSTTILAPDQFVTGVRGAGAAGVVLTGNAVSNGTSTAMVYMGPLSPSNPDDIHILPPVFSGQTVTTSTYYGPDTWLFNPGLGEGNVRLVGCYQYSESAERNHGMIYQGPPAGGGTWKQIDVPSSAVGGKSVWNTIPHSTMGDLVVGNYDLQGTPLSANAFIYDVANNTWNLFEGFGDGCTLTTAYGIWQSNPGGTSYTIVGGTRNGSGINQGFVVNYDSKTKAFTHLKLYSFKNEPDLVTHFEGITATSKGFNLAAGSDQSSAAFASIAVQPDGSFSEAAWVPFAYPGSAMSTGNTVYTNHLMGIFTVGGKSGVQSYLATIE